MNNAKLVETMKSLILAAKNEGFTPREAMQALMSFGDILHAAGVPGETLNEALHEVCDWLEASVLSPRDERQLDSTLN